MSIAAGDDAVIFETSLVGEAATGGLAATLAIVARRGDAIALEGDLGTGKTVFARAFIRARLAADELAAVTIPSPTFTLVQIYEAPSGDIWHFDLYRLETPDEAWELDIEDAFADGISLIEWPDRLGTLLPASALTVSLDYGGASQARRITFRGNSIWEKRIRGLIAR